MLLLAERFVLVEPTGHEAIISSLRIIVELHPDGIARLDVQYVIGIVQRRLLVVKGGESHPLEVPPISLLPSHHGPRRSPLGKVDRFDHLGHLVNEANGAGNVVEDGHRADALPRHGHVLEELEDGVGTVLERA